MKVLIVEDDVVSRSLLEKTLRALDHDAILAKDGQEAWNLLQTNNIRVVITDWIMCGIDCSALCHKIRNGNFAYYIYIILLTVKDGRKDLINGFESGADDFITKPVQRDELKAHLQAAERIIKLEERLKTSQAQLLQTEKMASIGQLAAGVAHEINNPTGFVSSNLSTLSEYQNDISRLLTKYRNLVADLKDDILMENQSLSIVKQVDLIEALEREMDIDFILDDILDLIQDCREGTERIKKIVIDLKDFAHPGEDKVQSTDLNKGIESTLNVVWNELKYKATISKEYGDLPLVKCYPQQINQVFMNILVNAAQAIEDRGEIKVATHLDDKWAEVEISDTGAGIPEERLSRIYDPFFTTKEVGKGTGLGLNVSYNIIKRHGGSIDVWSTVGKGTTFKIRIPVNGN